MQTTLRKLAVLGSLLAVMGAAQADIIKGRVVDTHNRPVAGAEVLVQSTRKEMQGPFFSTLHADENGNFSANLSPGYYGYYGQFYAVAPGMAPANIQLSPHNKDKTNIITLVPAQTISGRVVDQQGKPAAHVTMQLRALYNKKAFHYVFLIGTPWEKRYQTFTDKSGHWQLKAVPAGDKAAMMIMDPRYVSTLFDASINTLIHVSPGATLIGRVVDAAGKPAANIKVMAQGQRANEGWANATTAANGSYLLTGLSSGVYNIEVDAGATPLVAAAIEGQTAQQGHTEKMRDLVLTPGGIVTGQVKNSKTGEPVAGADVGSYGPHRPSSSGAIISDLTDANGRYTLRVAPGGSFVYLSGTGRGYIQKPNDGFNITVKEGETVTQNFEADPGETLSGTVVDRQGKLLAGVSIQVAAEKEASYLDNPSGGVSDANGHWSASGIAAGSVKVSAAAPWANVEPMVVTLPHPGDVRVVAQKLSDLPSKGRVVDIHQKPLAGVPVSMILWLSSPENGGILPQVSAVSDAQGNLHFEVPPKTVRVDINSAQKTGYVFSRGGLWDVKTGKLSDIVLDPLNNTVRGNVINQQGKPVPGVRVWVAGFDHAAAKTNKTGGFTFTGLPHRQITLLAMDNNGVAKSIPPSGKTATLRLAPLPANHLPTRAQSLDMLEKLYRTTTDKTFYAHSIVAYEITQYDLQRGLNLLKEGNGKISFQQIDSVLYLLEEKNPTRALQWGKDHLADVTAADDRIQLLCEMAKLAEPQDGALAQKYFSEATALAQTFPAPAKKTYGSDEPIDSPTGKFLYSRGMLAGAAAKVRPGETHYWMVQILPYTVDPSQGSRGDYDWARDLMAQVLGADAPQEMEELIENSSGRTKTLELTSAVRVAAHDKKTELAQRWLDQLSALYKQNGTKNTYPRPVIFPIDVGSAVRSLIELVGPKDPSRALKLAHLVNDQNETAQSLMVAGSYQPRKTALAVWKEAFELQWPVSSNNLARMAALVYDIDPAQGKILFNRLLQRYQEQQQGNNPSTERNISGADLAYFLARYKPFASWEILQNIHAKAQFQPNQGAADWDTVLAMSALNFKEAMNWARQITPHEAGFNYDAQRKLLQLALATPQVRRTVRLDRLRATDTWTPGEPTEW